MALGSEGNVANPFTTNNPDSNSAIIPNMGRGGEWLVSEIHGPWYTGSVRKALFGFNVTAVTVPVVASSVVSVFSLYNPVGSTINMELVDFDMGLVLATTVVNTIGLYTHVGTAAAAATFSTKGTPQPGMQGSSGAFTGGGLGYTALTHSGTPTRVRILGLFGAVTTNVTQHHQDINGKVVLGPGTIASVLASTAAMFTAGTDLAMTWQEPAIA